MHTKELVILALSSILFVSGPVYPQRTLFTPHTEGVTKGSGGKKARHIRGKIDSVDTGEGIFTLNGEKFRVVDSTGIELSGKKASLSDLSPGDEVTVSYTERDGEKIALHISSGTHDPGPPCKKGYHRCGHHCCKD